MGGTESRELAPSYTTPSGSPGTRHSPARDGPKRRRRSASVNCDPTDSPCSDNPSAQSPPLTIHVMDPRSRKTIVDELRRNSVAHNDHCGGLHGLQQHRALAKRLSSGATRRRAGSASAVSAASAKGLTAPPVFPKNLSLFDDRFNGGVYQDPRQDTELMSAVLEARKRWASGSGRTNEAASTRTTPPPPEFSDTRREEADAEEADTADSGRSSLTDVSSIPFQTAPSSRRVSLLPSASPEQQNKGRVRSDTDAGAPSAARQRRSSSAAAVLTHQRSNESDNSEEFSSPDEEEVFSDSSDHKPTQYETVNVTPRPIVTPRRQLEKRFRKASTDSRKKTGAGSPRKSSWQRGLMRLRALSASSPKRRGSEGEKPSAQPFGSGNDLNREWEIVTVREMCRRLSLEDSFEPSELPLPEGATQSQILDEYMIRQILDVLPPRAEGYPWVNIYNSEKHGFSLATLYRKMSEWKEEMSPILLIVRDVNGHVFGAIASTALRPAEHYYGTGDSCLLFRFTGEYPHTRELRTFTWTGDNQFFVNATKDFFSMGAGGGHSGLWLDADLNHGRSQKCATFDNEPLAGGEKEDFVIQFVEAFGFSMS